VPSYAAVFGQPTVGKCIGDHLVKPSLTGTALGMRKALCLCFPEICHLPHAPLQSHMLLTSMILRKKSFSPLMVMKQMMMRIFCWLLNPASTLVHKCSLIMMAFFCKSLCELDPSSMEMVQQKCILCIDDFSYGEPSAVIAGEKPAIGEQDLSGSPKNFTGLLPDVSNSHSKYSWPNCHVVLYPRFFGCFGSCIHCPHSGP